MTADPLRPTLMTRLRAGLAGERDARTLEALRQAGMGAYQELMLADRARDRLAAEGVTVWTAPPAVGSHLLAAWAAVALQRLGETLLDATYTANPATVGYVYPVTFQQVWRWLAAVGRWLARAGEARGNPGYDICAVRTLPAGLPVGPVARDCPAEHRDAMLLAMTVLREHAEVAMHQLELQAPASAEQAVGELRQMAGRATASADYVAGLRVAHDDTRLHALIDDKARVALNLWFHIGQIAAMPTLLATYRVPSAVRLLDPASRSAPPPPTPTAPPPRPAPTTDERSSGPDAGAAFTGRQAAAAPHAPPRPVPLLTGIEVAGERTFEGAGNALIQLDLPEAPSTAVISHRGSGAFTVWSTTRVGLDMDLLVNQIGGYRGERALNFVDVPGGLKVSASGTWRIVVRPLPLVPEWTGDASGEGAAVLRMSGASASGLTLVRFSHSGPGYVGVTAYAQYAESLLAEAGPCTGDLLLPADSFAVEIDADGPWTLREI